MQWNTTGMVALVAAAIVLLVSCGAQAVEREKYEQPDYTVLREAEGYEIREYPPQIVARIFIEGDAGRSWNKAFRPLANYIFGDNTKKDEIAMTSPVLQSEADASMEIAMTSPVLQSSPEEQEDTEGQWVMFIMPSEYSLEELPAPNDDRVEIAEMPAQTLAVISFSWMAGESKLDRKHEELVGMLERDGFEIVGEPINAVYDPPWTLPWKRLNEVMLPVEYEAN